MKTTDLFKDAFDFPKVKLTKTEKSMHDQVFNIIDSFFTMSKVPSARVNGILLYGKPQSGKSETLKQVCRDLASKYRGLKVAFLDSAQIAHPEYGVSDRLIRSVFDSNDLGVTKRIIFFDDIDCIFFGRENVTSQSWHISLSSVMFHCLDTIDTRNTAFLATSNMKGLMDIAMQSRLLQLEMPMPSRDEIERQVEIMVKEFPASQELKDAVIERIKGEMIEGETGFRDIQFKTVKYLTAPSIGQNRSKEKHKNTDLAKSEDVSIEAE